MGSENTNPPVSGATAWSTADGPGGRVLPAFGFSKPDFREGGVYSEGVQLGLPLVVLRAAEAARETDVTAVERSSYETLHEELEGLLRGLQSELLYGDEFRERWDEARTVTCESHGWSVEGFYAELRDRRWVHLGGPAA